MLLYYIRHGDPIYHPDSLTPLGEEQAAAVARRLALFGVDEVYSSPSNRAILTAKHTCDLLDKPLHTLDFLNENALDGLKLLREDERVDWLWSHPTYAKIYDGAWLNEEEYSVVHRIASSGVVKGAGSFCMEWASAHTKNLKIDTHADNYVMQNMLKKCGFQPCGTIYLENGEQRIGFQKICENK
jgi:hypothetical protein